MVINSVKLGFSWVFHILPDKTGYSAIWVAQRVPDDSVTVVANMFTIRDVNLSDTENFMGSLNMHSTALELGLWDGEGALDFTAVYSDGEYSHKYYSGRRMWGALDWWRPSLKLNATYGDLRTDLPHPFPWSVVPEEKVSVGDMIALHRYHYEGTAYDMTKGIQAGPFGTPDRYGVIGLPNDKAAGSIGAWERSIGLYRTTYTWILASRAKEEQGVIWFGPADADKTVFLPLMVAMGDPPRSLMVGHQAVLDRASSYWSHRYVQNIVQLKVLCVFFWGALGNECFVN